MNINLINFLILLKNASLTKKESIYCKYNYNFEKILKILYKFFKEILQLFEGLDIIFKRFNLDIV